MVRATRTNGPRRGRPSPGGCNGTSGRPSSASCVAAGRISTACPPPTSPGRRRGHGGGCAHGLAGSSITESAASNWTSSAKCPRCRKAVGTWWHRRWNALLGSAPIAHTVETVSAASTISCCCLSRAEGRQRRAEGALRAVHAARVPLTSAWSATTLVQTVSLRSIGQGWAAKSSSESEPRAARSPKKARATSRAMPALRRLQVPWASGADATFRNPNCAAMRQPPFPRGPRRGHVEDKCGGSWRPRRGKGDL